jgi:hypothetical protein
MVFKPGMEAQKQWRWLNGPELVAKVVTGVKFVDGDEQIASTNIVGSPPELEISSKASSDIIPGSLHSCASDR